MADIRLQNISHSYADPPQYVVADIDLHWRDGGAYALLGPSGCGKTTLLNIMSGLIRPTVGRVLYGDRDVTALSTRDRNIAQVFQFPVIYDTMTVFDNLAFPLRNRRVDAAEVTRRVDHIADMLELTPMLGQRAARLTPDLKQIISLGRGLVRDDVAAILFDEPLTVIDPHRKWVLRRKLRAIHQQFAHTMIYVTHDQTEALTFADEVVVMHEGQVLQQGTPEQLFSRPAHTQVGYFIGSPGMNFLPCRVDGDACVIADHTVPLPDGVAGATGELPARATEAAAKVELGIRPEHIELTAAPGGDGDGGGSGLPLVIDHVEDHGRFYIIAGAIGPHRVKARHDGAVPGGAPEAGQTRRVNIPPRHACLYVDGRLVTAMGTAMGTAVASTADTGTAGTDAGAEPTP